MASGNYVNVPDNALNPGYGSFELVSQRIDLSQNYADQSFSMTQSYIDTMGALLTGLQLPSVSTASIVGPEVVSLDYAKRPNVSNLGLDLNFPVKQVTPLNLASVPALSTPIIPTLTFSAPAWYTPERPVMDHITPPGDAPALNAVVLPPSQP